MGEEHLPGKGGWPRLKNRSRNLHQGRQLQRLSPTYPTRVPAASELEKARGELKGKGVLLNKMNKTTQPRNYRRLQLIIGVLLKKLGRAFSWQGGVKAARAWMGPFIMIGSILAGKVCPFLVLGLYDLVRNIHNLAKKQGPTGAAMYLKAATVYLYRYASGFPLRDRAAFGPVVGLTRSGIPLILPVA